MTEIEINQNININSNDAPPVTPEPEIEINDLYYNCSECPSLIEILSINEDNNIIEFKCLNKDKENNHEKNNTNKRIFIKNGKL